MYGLLATCSLLTLCCTHGSSPGFCLCSTVPTSGTYIAMAHPWVPDLWLSRHYILRCLTGIAAISSFSNVNFFLFHHPKPRSPATHGSSLLYSQITKFYTSSHFLEQITQIHITITKYMRFTNSRIYLTSLKLPAQDQSDLLLWALGWDVGRQWQGIGSRINCLFYGKKTRSKEITATNPLEWYIHNNIRTSYSLTSWRFYQLPIMPPWKLTL